MQYRVLGNTGLSVSVIGLGCSRLGSAGRTKTRAEMARLLEHAVDRGITFFDSADVYMGGESERLLGEVLGRRRDRVVLATKVGFRSLIPEALTARVRPHFWSAVQQGSMGARLAKQVRTFLARHDFSAGHLRTAVETSLTRLRTDRIDLLQLHSPSVLALDRDKAFETLERLRSEGKIRFYGLAFATLSQAMGGLCQETLSTLQLPISVGAPAGVDTILAWARSRDIGIIANQPLRKGALLHGSLASKPASAQQRAARTLVQAAIRFVSGLAGVTTVIVGTTNTAHLDEIIDALDSPPLTDEEIACLREEGPR